MDHHVLRDQSYRVPAVPDARDGVAWLRSHAVRFSEDGDHRRRRQLTEDLLAAVPAQALRRPGDPVATLAAGLGLARSVAADVAIVAAAYQPHVATTVQADDAVRRLVAACGGRWDEPTAARICLLVQACAATRAMIAGADPPVPVTRRVAPDGDVVEVSLAGAPFGAGRHACPGREHAAALVDGATAFHRLHDGPWPLILPNAWDVSSAIALVRAGFPAVGTTSAGLAAAQGVPDARGRTAAATLELAARLARLPVPVTVDIESGFGADVGELGARLAELGVAGVNIEDGRGDGLGDADEHAQRVARLKEAAPSLFVNARVDTYWLGLDRVSTVARACRYVDAGADGIFVPGLFDAGEIETVVGSVAVPVNVLAQGDVETLAGLGVRRISTGSSLFRRALRAVVDEAVAVRDGLPLGPAVTYAQVESGTAWWVGLRQ